MSDAPDWIALLALEPTTEVVALGGSSLPLGEVGHGDAGLAVDLGNLHPSYSRAVFTTPADESPLSVYRWDPNASILRLTTRNEYAFDVKAGRTHAESPNDLRLDTRDEAAVVLLPTPEGVVAIHAVRGSVQMARIVRRSSRIFDALVREPDATPLLSMQPPQLDQLLEGADVEPWLGAAYAQLVASPSPADRVAGLGLIVRLWRPTTEASRRLAVRWLVEGRGTVARRVAEWIGAASATTAVEAAIDHAIARALSVQQSLSALAQLALDAEDEVVAGVVANVEVDRDDLESVAVAGGLVGIDVTALRSALDRIDDIAALHATLLDDLGPNDRDARFDRVAEEHPSAWWARGC